VAAAALAVGAISPALMDIGMAGYDPGHNQHRQEDESHNYHAQTAGTSG
jgi:hypothetical protein